MHHAYHINTVLFTVRRKYILWLHYAFFTWINTEVGIKFLNELQNMNFARVDEFGNFIKKMPLFFIRGVLGSKAYSGRSFSISFIHLALDIRRWIYRFSHRWEKIHEGVHHKRFMYKCTILVILYLIMVRIQRNSILFSRKMKKVFFVPLSFSVLKYI